MGLLGKDQELKDKWALEALQSLMNKFDVEGKEGIAHQVHKKCKIE